MICKRIKCTKIVASKSAGLCSTHYDQEIFRVKKPLYRTWQGMKSRCYDHKNRNYYLYGGRGIKVCERWLNSYDDYANDIASLGPKPSPAHSLDRIDNDGNYEPGNVRWATKKEQIVNRRAENSARKSNKSGHIGITQRRDKWEARGRHGIHIGYFNTIEEAVKARAEWLKNTVDFVKHS